MDFYQILSIVIFVVVLTMIVTEKIHKTLAALIGAVLVLITGVMPFEDSLHHVDFNTLGVLVGMMMVVGVMKRSGLFEFLAISAAKLAKGDPWRIMVYLMIITAVLSALLDNVTTVLLVGPMTFMICRELKINPVPYIMTLIISSNVGGTATLIGDPPNIMIGSGAGLTFIDFIMVDAPIVIVIMVVTIIVFKFVYGNKLVAEQENIEKVMQLNANDAIISKSLFIKSIVMIGVVALGFSLHGVLHLESSVIALTCAAIMMLIGGQSIEEIVHDVEWPTIGFFGGLFITVGGLVATGVLDMFAYWLVDVTAGNTLATVLLILFASAIVSAILDNIPFTAAMIPVILTMEATGMDVTPLWWALSLGACLGGNGTLIGASANVVLSGISSREGHPITFIEYLKIGAPMMIMSVIIAAIYLVLRFCI